MTNVVRELCSKKKIRLKDGRFNLDLSYILPNVIAMGFPAEKMEAWYRNDRKDFKEYMNERHKSCYKIYNLCKEKNYDIAAFENRVECYPFVDHQPPRFDTILPFCQSVDQWLKASEDNVVAVHCKAGKGRTGVMISSYLLYAGVCKTASEALEFFAKKRTYDERGVTIPSQRCYVHYFEKMLREGLTYRPVKIELKAIHVQGLYLKKVMPSKLRVYANSIHTIVVSGSADTTRIIFARPIALQGDVRVKFIYDSGLVARNNNFSAWFNTFMCCTLVDRKSNEKLGDAASVSYGSKSYTESAPCSDKSPAAVVSPQTYEGSGMLSFNTSRGTSSLVDNSHNTTTAQPRQSSSSSTSSSTEANDPLVAHAFEKQPIQTEEQSLPPTENRDNNDAVVDCPTTLHTLTMSGEEFDVKSKKPASKFCSTDFKITFVYSCLNEEHSKYSSAGSSNVVDFPVHLPGQKLNVDANASSTSSFVITGAAAVAFAHKTEETDNISSSSCDNDDDECDYSEEDDENTDKDGDDDDGQKLYQKNNRSSEPATNARHLLASSPRDRATLSRSPGGGPGRRKSSSDRFRHISSTFPSHQHVSKMKNREFSNQKSEKNNQIVGRLPETTSKMFIQDGLDTKC